MLFVAIFQIGVGAKQLFRSEVPGPMTEGLRPKIKETALALLEDLCLYDGIGSPSFYAFRHGPL